MYPMYLMRWKAQLSHSQLVPLIREFIFSSLLFCHRPPPVLLLLLPSSLSSSAAFSLASDGKFINPILHEVSDPIVVVNELLVLCDKSYRVSEVEQIKS